MSKFLYPIYKLNIESYKKWWLYHKKAGGSGILSEILQGFSFNLENTLNRKFKLFEIEGNRVQDGSPSPDNEVPIKSAGDNENYLKEEWEQGAYSGSNGVSKIDSNQYVRSKEFSTIEPNKEYTSKCVVNGVEYIQGNIFFYKEDESFISSITNISSTFTTPENAKKVKYNIFKSSGITPEDVDYAKLEKGNKASGYSPYGMGSINEKISNKNFANNAGNGYIASDGGIAVSNVAFYNDFILIPENENNVYYYGSNLSSSMSNVYTNRIAFYNENQEKISVIGSISTPTIYAIPNGAKYVRASWLNAVENPMLVFGGAIPYVPHQEQDYSIFVQQPFRSIGDVRDLFFKNTVDSPYYDENLTLNGWYERHYIGEKILNGTENWGISGNQNYFYYVNNDFPTIPGTGGVLPDMQCNYYQISTYNHIYNANDDYGVTLAINNNHFLVLRNKDITTIAELKTWLSTHNVVVQYEAETPLDLPCTQSQIQQLENKPSTYKDFTIINSEDETPAYLKIQYYKEG